MFVLNNTAVCTPAHMSCRCLILLNGFNCIDCVRTGEISEHLMMRFTETLNKPLLLSLGYLFG